MKGNEPEKLEALLDANILSFYRKCKEKFPDMYVNGAQHNFCGYRPSQCTVGAPNSAHKKGQAIDMHCRDLNGLRLFVLEHGPEHGITRMEEPASTQGWCHIDTYPITKKPIYVFKP
jgi:hypothetical protein